MESVNEAETATQLIDSTNAEDDPNSKNSTSDPYAPNFSYAEWITNLY